MTTSEEAHDQRYPTLREHLDLRERVTVVEGESRDVKESLRRIENMLTAQRPPVQAAAPETAAALALHRALDAFDKPRGQSPNILSHVGVLAIGAFVAWAFMVLS